MIVIGIVVVLAVLALTVPTVVDTVRRDALTERGWVVSFPRKDDGE